MSYAGADWVERDHRDRALSPIGRATADLLGEVFRGIYHIQDDIVTVDWWNQSYVEVPMTGTLSTFDSDTLTRLVVLAHDRAIRLQIGAAERRVCAAADCWRREASHFTPASPDDGTHAFVDGGEVAELALLFSQRSRQGGTYERHPTLEEAAARIRAEAGERRPVA